MANLLDEDGNVLEDALTNQGPPSPKTGKPATGPTTVAPPAGPKMSQPGGESPLSLFMSGIGARLHEGYEGLTGGEKEPTDALLMQNWPALAGYYVPDLFGGAVTKAKMLPQAAYGAATGAIKPGSVIERIENAGKGAVEQALGQGAADTIVRGANRMRGVLSPMGQVAETAEQQGINMTAGDILQNPALRGAEKASVASPSGKQAEQLAEMMHQPGGDPLSKAVVDAHENAMNKVGALADQLDNTPGIRPVVPRETANTLRDLYRVFPESFNQIANHDVRDKLLEIAQANKGQIPAALSFSDLKTLAQSVGPIQAKLERAAAMGQVGPGVGKDVAAGWSKLYGSTMQDLENWGAGKPVEQGVMDTYNQMKDVFKQEVLPLRQNPIANKIINGTYARPEDLVRDVAAPRNRSVVGDISARLPEEGRNLVAAVQNMPRGVREYSSGAPQIAAPTSLRDLFNLIGSAAATVPAQLLNRPSLRELVKASSEAGPGVYPLLREGAIFGGDEAMRSRAGKVSPLNFLAGSPPQ